MITDEEREAKELKFIESWAEQDTIYATCDVDLSPYEEPNEESCKEHCPDYEHRFMWCQEAHNYRNAIDHMNSFARAWADGCIAYEDGEWIMSILPMNDPEEAIRRIEGMFSAPDIETVDSEGNPSPPFPFKNSEEGTRELIKQMFGFKMPLNED